MSVIDATGDDYYEVEFEKPVPIKFCRGNDGGAYVRAVAKDPRIDTCGVDFAEGDRLVAISASFGSEVWEAENYGQCMFAMKTRSGGIYLKFKKCYGDLTAIEDITVDEHLRERNSGNYGAGTKEKQMRNYNRMKELQKERAELFNEGLSAFGGGDYRKALELFEDVIGSEPANYMGDDFSRYTLEYRLAHYNVACCCSKLGEKEAGLDALVEAMNSGFEDFKKIRSDPNLEAVRDQPVFEETMNKYDEPVINAGAVKMFKSIFGGN